MVKNYERFIENLCNKLVFLTGFSKDQFEIVHNEEDVSGSGDRLYIEIATHYDAREVCGIHIEELYERYQCELQEKDDQEKDDSYSEEIISEMAEDIYKQIKNALKSDYYENTKKLESYQEAKSELFVRVINYERYKKELKDAVYKRVGDIVLVLHMRIQEDAYRLASVKVQKAYLKLWEIEEEELFREALLNTYFLSPPRIFRWEKLIFDPEYAGENFMDLLSNFEMKKDIIGNCLSTVKRTNGAIAIFLPGVAERLCRLMGSSIYLVFTSVHEVMIHSDKLAYAEDLKKVLKETLEEATPEKDYLTSNIYHYDHNTKMFRCISMGTSDYASNKKPNTSSKDAGIRLWL